MFRGDEGADVSYGYFAVIPAAFDGKHGWFWRDGSGMAVTVTLKTSVNCHTI